jgi:hypothetical protein
LVPPIEELEALDSKQILRPSGLVQPIFSWEKLVEGIWGAISEVIGDKFN